MNAKGLGLMALAAAVVAPAAASAQTLGPRVGWFFPVDANTTDALGKDWFNFGFGPVENDYRGGARNIWDVSLLGRDRNGNKVFITSLSYGYEYAFGDSRKDSTVPFVAARSGPSYMDYSITNPENSVRYSTKRGGWNVNLEAGLLFNETFQISLRYDWMSKFDGFSFDGWSIQAEWELVRF